MKKFINWLSEVLVPKMNALVEKPWLSAISMAMMKSVPYILVGSLIFLYNVFKGYIPQLPDLGPIANYTFGIIGLIISFLIGQQCMEKLEHRNYLTSCGIISIAVMFMFIFTESDAAGNMIIPGGRLGPSGILIGILSGIFTAVIFHLYAKLNLLHNSNLPDFVLNWIHVVLPTFVCLLLAMILTVSLNIDIFAFVVWLFSPLQNFAQTLPGMIILCLMPAIMFSFGVSSWMWAAVSTPIYLAAINENITAVANGLQPTNFTTNEAIFASGLIMMGGIGATLALNVLMLFSKSKQVRTMGKIFIGPSIFNINEPVIYGAPIVLNPILMIPFWLTAIIGPCVLWLVFTFDLLNVPSILFQINNLPLGFGAVMATQDVRGIFWAIAFFILYLIIWYPFFKVYEKQKIAEEEIEHAENA